MADAPTRWLARNADGRLELFIVGVAFGAEPGIALWHLWQTGRNNGWSNWASHGAPPGSNANWNGPAVAPSEDGRLELFFVYSGAVWHRWQTGPNNGWSSWASRGAPSAVKLVGHPTLGRSADNRLELFVVGTDGALWHTWQTAPNNGWSAWTSHGAPAGSGGLRLRPAVASGADGRLELFGVGEDRTVWHKWQTAPNGGWSDWISHGRPPGVELGSLPIPAVAPSADGRLELFVVGEDGVLWHLRQTAPDSDWSDWTSRGRPTGTKFKSFGPAVAPSAGGRLELFIVGEDGALWHTWQTAPSDGWSNWTPRGRPPSPPGRPPINLVGYPALAANAEGRLELFIAGNDNLLWHQWQTAPNDGWSDWTSHGAPEGFGFFGA